jgi:hypothetical protein
MLKLAWDVLAVVMMGETRDIVSETPSWDSARTHWRSRGWTTLKTAGLRVMQDHGRAFRSGLALTTRPRTLVDGVGTPY